MAQIRPNLTDIRPDAGRERPKYLDSRRLRLPVLPRDWSLRMFMKYALGLFKSIKRG